MSGIYSFTPTGTIKQRLTRATNRLRTVEPTYRAWEDKSRQEMGRYYLCDTQREKAVNPHFQAGWWSAEVDRLVTLIDDCKRELRSRGLEA